MLGEIAAGIKINRGKEFEIERHSIGVALVIVGIDPSRNGENSSDPKIWTLLEKKSKAETEKTAGQISFPGETKKSGEKLNSNIIGALAEFSRNDFVIKNNLFFVPQSYHEGVVAIRNNPVDLVVLFYNGGLDRSFKPVDQEDVAAHRWMTVKEINELMKENPEKVRKFARDIVSMESSEKKIEKVIDEYIHSPLKRLPISILLPQTFSSMEQFHNERERMIDVRVFQKNPK